MRSLLVLALGLPLTVTACSPSKPSLGSGKVSASLGSRDAGTTSTIQVGEQVEVRLSSPRGVAPEYRHEWSSSPRIEGEALRFVTFSREAPGKNVDGGSVGYLYWFEGAAPGEATVTIDIVEPGDEVHEETWTATIRVTE